MRKAVPYLVSGAIFIAIGLCMLLSPVSLGTLAIALVAIYIECEGIRSLLATRKEYGPRWLFILITIKNATDKVTLISKTERLASETSRLKKNVYGQEMV